MKIVHLCLSCFYIDGYSYQENELVRQNVLDGHDVTVIASTETYGDDGRLTYVEPSEYMGAEGAKVIRLPYRKGLPEKVMRKLRLHPGVFELLEREAPDVVLFHGLCGGELLAVKRYKAHYPDVKVYADSHEDFNNSARSLVSKYLLHWIYYRNILKSTLGSIEKVLCISVETISFVRDFYGVPAEQIEFFPLGGFVYEDSDYQEIRLLGRSEYGVGEDQILFVQTGKMGAAKKVLESLRAFTKIDNPKLRFVLAGHFHDDVAGEAAEIIKKDDRIRFVGWKSSEDLRILLCAADVYVQPGTQSATMQMSLCARCAVILDDVPSHKPYRDGNGWLIGKGVTLDDALREASTDFERLSVKSRKSARIASRLLDYKMLAARLYA